MITQITYEKKLKKIKEFIVGINEAMTILHETKREKIKSLYNSMPDRICNTISQNDRFKYLFLKKIVRGILGH